MPAVANQLPSANQAVALPTERESSSIPKGGTDSTWLYPSPQMVRFYCLSDCWGITWWGHSFVMRW